MNRFDVAVIGAGAAGMMAAAEAGRRGRSVLVVDHARAPGEKIRISGGGRCNFTNLGATPANFLSANPRFAISALKRYTPRDFIALVERHRIAWHEKKLGQLFCDGSARQIVEMLVAEMAMGGVTLRLATPVSGVEHGPDGFRLALAGETVEAASLVVATGGLSIPKMGATDFGYRIARQFGIAILPTRPGLVPLTLDPALLEKTAPLAGLSVEGRASFGKTGFDEALLFTHRGISGPAILQISSFWKEGEPIRIALAPSVDLLARLREARATNGRQAPATLLGEVLPKRLALFVSAEAKARPHLADCSDAVLTAIDASVNGWMLRPNGSEGYRTAEVTVGGVDTAELDQKTMMAKRVPGLFFVGEVVDVTGWLGGYNFQWAWASGWAAGQAA
ncbi:NAD(P)/FAD-dependent oxidoreductase [Kaistia geumhonensis]|uniref:Rossmann fold flavoprotein n=1 Tax=Kaistia geumhonensis TaxID=410839 RepID=A0ABU0M1U6_9HYPH|nr:NAD(P)/FAD-dependent oxidoreductase [Kaistia geumhonensis]MCX5479853.1 NAD(P)/FAD-dependent oxidoreductase [Kaistia geumhonensis]MDQ0514921.1 putative Rossmann fold flavoprotein [Kaistia geumhonensis]